MRFPRLRMRLTLLNYDLKVDYVPGRYIYIVDYLSRNHIETGNSEEAVLSLSVGSKWEERIRQATEDYELLKRVSHYCLKGWPGDKSKVFGRWSLVFRRQDSGAEVDETGDHRGAS